MVNVGWGWIVNRILVLWLVHTVLPLILLRNYIFPIMSSSYWPLGILFQPSLSITWSMTSRRFPCVSVSSPKLQFGSLFAILCLLHLSFTWLFFNQFLHLIPFISLLYSLKISVMYIVSHGTSPTPVFRLVFVIFFPAFIIMPTLLK